jgi:hypothetical protein
MGWGFMTLDGLTVGETLVLGFLAETSPIKEEDKILLMVLLENTASSRSLGHPGKGILGHCN